MIDVEAGYLLTPVLAFLIAAGAPGPATLATAATAMAHGWRSGLALGCGLALSLALWGVVAAVGLGALLTHWAPAATLLRLAGGAFLLYLAWVSAKSALGDEAGRPASDPASHARLFRRGFLLNILNPKALLAWSAVIALGLPANAGAAHIAAITVLCSLVGLLVYVLYAALFSRPAVMNWRIRFRRWIDGAMAAVFGYAGLHLLTARAEAP